MASPDLRPQYLINLTPSESNIPELLKKISGILRRMKLPRRIDVESLTHDIWLEGWTRKMPITVALITQRAINEVHRVRDEIALFDMVDVKKLTFTDIESHDSLESIMNRVVLTFDQIRVIHLLYDTGLTIKEIAETLGWTESRAGDVLRQAIEKLQGAARGVK